MQIIIKYLLRQFKYLIKLNNHGGLVIAIYVQEAFINSFVNLSATIGVLCI
jgi:hypothetical protein